MKKNTKFLVLLLALLMMCLCLTGCDELDELKKQQAIWVEKGDTSAFIYNGVEYKRIDVPNPPTPISRYYENIKITDPDVPVLLADRFSVMLDLSVDENFVFGYLCADYTDEYIGLSGGVRGYAIYENSSYDPTEEVLYCKADIYDDVINQINEGIEFSNYCYDYYKYNEELGYEEFFLYTLTDEETELINNIEKTVEPFESYNYNSEYMFCLYKTNKDNMFFEESYDVYRNEDGSYYISKYDSNEDIVIEYKVPDEFKDKFDEFCDRGVLMM